MIELEENPQTDLGEQRNSVPCADRLDHRQNRCAPSQGDVQVSATEGFEAGPDSLTQLFTGTTGLVIPYVEESGREMALA